MGRKKKPKIEQVRNDALGSTPAPAGSDPRLLLTPPEAPTTPIVPSIPDGQRLDPRQAFAAALALQRQKANAQVVPSTVVEPPKPPLMCGPTGTQPPPTPILNIANNDISTSVRKDPRALLQQVSGKTDKDLPATATPTNNSSGYAMTSHKGDLISEDIYVSENESDDENILLNEKKVEILLNTSRMGLMRRGGFIEKMTSRQWIRPGDKDKGDKISSDKESSDINKAESSSLTGGEDGTNTKDNEEDKEEMKQEQIMDPAARAAQLLIEKQRKLEEAKEQKRMLESSENAGRDPCLFSKRTAFDIRFDQIEEKPWVRGSGDVTDYFNYGLTEEDWLEYSERQLAVRQELTDANRQRRVPDPNIVPVVARTPSRQQPKVAVAVKKDGDAATSKDGTEDVKDSIGPVLPSGAVVSSTNKISDSDKNNGSTKESKESISSEGGAWGAGAKPGSKLAKIIEEQERRANAGSMPPPPPPPPPRFPPPPPPPRPTGTVGTDYQQNQYNRSNDDDHGDPRQKRPTDNSSSASVSSDQSSSNNSNQQQHPNKSFNNHNQNRHYRQRHHPSQNGQPQNQHGGPNRNFPNHGDGYAPQNQSPHRHQNQIPNGFGGNGGPNHMRGFPRGPPQGGRGGFNGGFNRGGPPPPHHQQQGFHNPNQRWGEVNQRQFNDKKRQREGGHWGGDNGGDRQRRRRNH